MSKKKHITDEQKLAQAKVNFNKLMLQIEPFIKKSDIILSSTEGKWYDTTTTTIETVVIQNAIYS
jgi:hypothetical protein